MDEDQQHEATGMVDAEQFLRFSEALREDFSALASADLPTGARERWQRRLIAITNLAKRDLDRAEAQHQGFRADLERELGLDRPPEGGVPDR